MSTKNESLSLSLPSAKATATALTIAATASDADLTALGQQLARIEGSRSWWLGDYGLELKRRKALRLQVDELATEPKHANAGAASQWMDQMSARIEAKCGTYLEGRAESLGIDAGTWRNYVMACRYYEASYRNDALTFSHHMAVIVCLGVNTDAGVAQGWLLQAQRNNWSVSELRTAINRAKATAIPPSTDPEPNPYEPLDEADSWAIAHRDTEFTPELARHLLDRFAALAACIDRLREAAAVSKVI